MLNLHDGTFWHLHSRCCKIECFCFGLDCLILQCNIITLHLAVYFGKVEGLFERKCFSHYYLKNIQRLLLWMFNFSYVWTKFLAIGLFFSFSKSLLYRDLSTMFSRCLGELCKRLIVILGPIDVWFVQSMQQMCLGLFNQCSKCVYRYFHSSRRLVSNILQSFPESR